MRGEAVDILRVKLETPRVLALPQRDGHHIVKTNARDAQVGCVLLQEH